MPTKTLELKLSLSGLSRVTAGLDDVARKVVSMGAQAAAVGFGALTAALSAVTVAGVKYNATMEQQTVAFRTLLGNLDKAKARMAELAKFSKETPFELPEVVQASRVLQALTGGALASGEGLRAVGDAASAAGRPLEDAAFWIGRLYAGLQSGTPVGEATMRLVEMGLVTGDTKRELDGLAASGESAGKGLEIVKAKFAGFSGAMELQSKTFNGMLSNLTDGIGFFLGEATKPAFEAAKGLIGELLNFDYASAGQNVAAFFRLLGESIGNGNFKEFLALSIEAGFEQGAAGARAVWGRLVDFVKSSEFWKVSWKAQLDLATGMTEAMGKGLVSVGTGVAALFLKMGSNVNEFWHSFKELAYEVMAVVVNFFAEKIEAVINRAIEFANKVGASFGPVKLGRASGGTEPPPATMSWAEALQAAQEGTSGASGVIEEFFESARRAGAELLGYTEEWRDANNEAFDATNKLVALVLSSAEAHKEVAKAVVDEAVKTTKAKVDLSAMTKKETSLQNELLAMGRARSVVENDFTKTKAEKWALRKRMMEEEAAKLRELIALADERAKLTPGESEQLRARADGFRNKLGQSEAEAASMGANPNSVSEQLAATATSLKDQFGTVAESIARTFSTVVQSAVDGVANSISGLIMGTMTWGQALRNVANTILTSVVNAIARMFAEWIVGRLAVKAVEIASAGAEAVAKAPGALMTSISSYGVAAIIGIAALVAGIAALSGAFAEGGRPPAGRPALVGERGPELFVPDSSGMILPANVTESLLASEAAGGGFGGGGMKVAVFDDRQAMREWLESQEGQAAVVNIAGRNKHRFS